MLVSLTFKQILLRKEIVGGGGLFDCLKKPCLSNMETIGKWVVGFSAWIFLI